MVPEGSLITAIPCVTPCFDSAMQTNSKILQSSANYAYADVGNSRIKILHQGQTYAFSINEVTSADLSKFFESRQPARLYYSTVNPKNSDVLVASAGSTCPLECINGDIANSGLVDFAGVNGIGADRALGLIAASVSFPTPLITVDCGTATTINALDEKNRCRGGAIMPGILTQISSLSGGTAQLPGIKPFLPPRSAGKNTTEAIASGTVLASCHAIAGIIRSITEEEFLGAAPGIIVTGGLGPIVCSGLEGIGTACNYAPDLVLRGIEAVCVNKKMPYSS